jgi:arylsulfatase A-like enzyme
MGSHTPYTMNENAEYDPNNPTLLQQTKGCFKIVYDYIKQLKALGLYEDTTIIITTDHGYTNPKDGFTSDKTRKLLSPELSGLFYKPSGSAGTPMDVSDAAVSQEDFRATVMKEVGLPYEQYGTPYDQVTLERQTPRIHYHRGLDSTVGIKKRSEVLEEWEIRGDARDFSNWKKVRELPVEYWKEPGSKMSSWDKPKK